MRGRARRSGTPCGASSPAWWPRRSGSDPSAAPRARRRARVVDREAGARVALLARLGHDLVRGVRPIEPAGHLPSLPRAAERPGPPWPRRTPEGVWCAQDRPSSAGIGRGCAGVTVPAIAPAWRRGRGDTAGSSARRFWACTPEHELGPAGIRTGSARARPGSASGRAGSATRR